MKQPLDIVKKEFGDKGKLVAELEKFTKDDDLWVARTNKDKGLDHVSNAKLLRLHRTFTEVKEKFGTRAKLIDAIAEIAKRTKDDGFKKHLDAFPVPRLWDMYKSAAKRAGIGAKPKGEKRAGEHKARVAAQKKAAKPAAAKAPAKKHAAKKRVSKKA